MKRPSAMYVDRAILDSKAFLSLTGKSPQVLIIFYAKRQVEKLKRPDNHGNRFRQTNNGRIRFTYREARELFGLTSPCFRRALAQLVEVGFLDVTHRGGGLQRDASEFALSQRWRDFGTERFQAVSLPKGRPWQQRRPRRIEDRHGSL